MKLKIKFNSIAIKDIKEAREYIREENINAINKFIKGLRNIIERLAQFPEMGMKLSNKIEVETDYRYFIFEEYIIFYKFNNDNLFVYRILSSKRDYIKILFS